MKFLGKAVGGSELLQAIIWMLGSGLFFSCLNAQIRYLTTDLHPFEIAFFRNLFGLAFMLPWLFRSGMAGLRTGRLKLWAKPPARPARWHRASRLVWPRHAASWRMRAAA